MLERTKNSSYSNGVGFRMRKKEFVLSTVFLITIRNEVTDSIYKTKQQIESGLSMFFES